MTITPELTPHRISEKRYGWFDDMKSGMPEQEVLTMWYEKARKLNPEHFKGLAPEDNIPFHLIRELYPEILALGPAAPKIIKAFNVLRYLENWLEQNPKERQSNAIVSYYSLCQTSYISLGFFFVHIEPGNLEMRFRDTYILESNYKGNQQQNLVDETHAIPLVTGAVMQLSQPNSTVNEPNKITVDHARLGAVLWTRLENYLLEKGVIETSHLTGVRLNS